MNYLLGFDHTKIFSGKCVCVTLCNEISSGVLPCNSCGGRSRLKAPYALALSLKSAGDVANCKICTYLNQSWRSVPGDQ